MVIGMAKYPYACLKFVWRQSEFAFFGVLTSVGTPFLISPIKYTFKEKKMKHQNKQSSKLFVVTAFFLSLIMILSSCSFFHKHSYDEWKTYIEPTCTGGGRQSRQCSCGNVEMRNIPELGHNIVEGMCTNCKMIFDAQQALIHYVKTNGTKSDSGNKYSISMNVAGDDHKQILRFDADSSNLEFIETSASTITQVIVNPNDSYQTIGLVFTVSGSVYYASASIYASSFDVYNPIIFSYTSDAPISLRELLTATTASLLHNFITVLEKTETGITMDMLNFKLVE